MGELCTSAPLHLRRGCSHPSHQCRGRRWPHVDHIDISLRPQPCAADAWGWLRVPHHHTCEEHRLDCPLCVRHVQRATRVRAAAPSIHDDRSCAARSEGVALGRKGGGNSDGDGRGVCVGTAHSPASCVCVVNDRRCPHVTAERRRAHGARRFALQPLVGFRHDAAAHASAAAAGGG